MAFNDITFQFGETLTASAMSTVQSNFTAFANKETGVTATFNRAKAIVNYSGTSINFSDNVSSVTQNFVGSYNINFTFTYSMVTVNSVNLPSIYALGNAHDTTNGNSTVVYSMPYFNIGTAPYNFFPVFHHNFNDSADSYHQPVSATAVFFERNETGSS
jgi:hypothetical protein|tara:strand:+ start:37 stop:513 length:477 start_codon:yes stop_codon:yes gene_type:complete